MQYRIFKRDSIVEVKGLTRSIPDSLKKEEFILPFSQKADAVEFRLHGEQTLTAFQQYCTEIKYLTSLYSICRCLEIVSERSNQLLQFVLDSQYIFFDENESIRGILAPQNSEESIDYKGFFWNLFFTASFQSKNIPVVRELLGFVRAARAVTPRDLILFIEMSTLGKEILAAYHARVSESSDPEQQDGAHEETPDPNALQTGNDFSDFLKSFEQPFDLYEDFDDSPQSEQQETARSEAEKRMDSDLNVQDAAADGSQGNDWVDPLASEPQDAALDDPLASEQQDAALDEPLATEPQDAALDEPLATEPQAAAWNDPLASEQQDAALDEPLASEQQDAALDEPLATEPQAAAWNEPLASELPDPQDIVLDEPLEEKPLAPRKMESAPESARAPRINRILSSAPNAPLPQRAQRSPEPPAANADVSARANRQRADFAPPEPYDPGRDRPTQEMRYYLVASDGRSIPLTRERFQIGRSAESVDLTVQDMYVSRVHAQITRNASGIFYTDLNPRNPSFINGVIISPNKPHPLKDDDKIQIGKTVFYLRCVRAVR